MPNRYSQSQTKALNEVFQQTHYVDAEVKMALAETGLTDRQISVWFSRKRRAIGIYGRTSKKRRETGANGGASTSTEKSKETTASDEIDSELGSSTLVKIKPKRFSQSQIKALNEVLKRTLYVDAEVKMALAETGLTDRQIAVWFARKRRAIGIYGRISKKRREIIANGGTSTSTNETTDSDEIDSELGSSTLVKIKPPKWFQTRITCLGTNIKVWRRNIRIAKPGQIDNAMRKCQKYENIQQELIKRRHLVNAVAMMKTKNRPTLQRTYPTGQTPEKELRRFIMQEKMKDPLMFSTAMARLPEHLREAFQNLLNDENAWDAHFANPPGGTYSIPWENLDIGYRRHPGNMKGRPLNVEQNPSAPRGSRPLYADVYDSENESSRPVQKIVPSVWFMRHYSVIKNRITQCKKQEQSCRDAGESSEQIDNAMRTCQKYENILQEVLKRRDLVNAVRMMKTKNRPTLQRTYPTGQTPEKELRRFIMQEKMKDPLMFSTAMARLPEHLREAFQNLLNDENAWDAHFANPPGGMNRIPWENLDLSHAKITGNMRKRVPGKTGG